MRLLTLLALGASGMGNEGIIANFIYCYESENISESKLDFKLVVSGPNTHGHGDEFCTKALYGIGRCVPALPGLS